MAVHGFQNEFAIAQGDISIDNRLIYSPNAFLDLGTYSDDADNDKQDWGSPLITKKEGEKVVYHEINSDYIYLSFIVDCDSFNDFVAPQNLRLYINDLAAPIPVSFGSHAFASRAKKGAFQDTRVLIRINIPTNLIYNRSPIQNIRCQIDYGYDGMNIIDRTWNFSDPTLKVYETYRWVKNQVTILGVKVDNWYITNLKLNTSTESLYSEKISENHYSTKPIGTPNTYEGSIFLYSKTQEEGVTNQNFFTSEDGTINIQITTAWYVNPDPRSRWRVPSHIIFYSSKGDFKEYPTGYTFNNDIVALRTVTVEMSSNEIKNFCDIKEAQVFFGSNSNQKITIPITNSSFLNCDFIDDFGMSFSRTDGISNSYDSMTEDRIITLKSSLSGEITAPNNCPYQFNETEDAEMISKDLVAITNVNISKPSSLSVTKFYNCEVTENDSLDIDNQCTLKPGTYSLKCEVTNKLNGNVVTKTFVIKNLTVVKGTTSEYVAFKNLETLIYSGDHKYKVPGDIIVPGEILLFNSSDNSKPDFQVYDLLDGKKVEKVSSYPIINEISTKSQWDPIIKNTFFSYGSIKQVINKEDKTDTIPITVEYDFYLNDSNLKPLHCFADSFILGREKTPNYSISAITDTSIKYFLRDNGADRYDGLSSNRLIEQRKQAENPTYFNLSRMPKNNNKAQEHLLLTFIYQEYNKDTQSEELKEIPFRTEFTSLELLNTGLNFLRENRTNTLELSSEFLENDSDKIKTLFDALSKYPVRLKIELIYIYDEKTLAGNTVFSIETPEITFIQRISPIGLRKRGVIVNPTVTRLESGEEEIEDLDNNNTFVINVKNVERTENKAEWIKQNGLKIVFQTVETKDNQIETLPTFEVLLDNNGHICFYNGTTLIHPFGGETSTCKI